MSAETVLDVAALAFWLGVCLLLGWVVVQVWRANEFLGVALGLMVGGLAIWFGVRMAE